MRRYLFLLILGFLCCQDISRRPTTTLEEDMQWARYWYRNHHFIEAIKKFEDALEKDPDYIPALLGLANSRRELGKLYFSAKERSKVDAEHNLAVIYFQRVLRLQPGNLAAHHGLGQLYFERAMALEEIFTPQERKRYRELCINHYRKVIEKEPTNFTAHRDLGIAYSTIPDKENGLRHLEIYLKAARYNLERLKATSILTQDLRAQIRFLEREIANVKGIIESLKKLK
jgi:tetratricopeptide (TPR) repeat protein